MDIGDGKKEQKSLHKTNFTLKIQSLCILTWHAMTAPMPHPSSTMGLLGYWLLHSTTRARTSDSICSSTVLASLLSGMWSFIIWKNGLASAHNQILEWEWLENTQAIYTVATAWILNPLDLGDMARLHIYTIILFILFLCIYIVNIT